MSRTPLSPEREAEAQQLFQAIRQATEDELLAVARALVATDEATLFGDTEFHIRELVLKAGAKAYQTFLAQKKTAIAAPLCLARPAAKLPSSRTTSAARP